nr:MAG TPA: nucleoid-associated protein [Caudoviricetes sp.]
MTVEVPGIQGPPGKDGAPGKDGEDGQDGTSFVERIDNSFIDNLF